MSGVLEKGLPDRYNVCPLGNGVVIRLVGPGAPDEVLITQQTHQGQGDLSEDRQELGRGILR